MGQILPQLALPALLLLVAFIVVILLIWRRRRAAVSKAEEKPQKPREQKNKKKKKGKRPSVRRVDKKPAKSGATKAKPQPVDSSTKILGGPPTKPSPIAPPKEGRAPAGERIRILIVDDNTGTRENVSRLLYFEDDLEVIGQAVNGRHGVDMASELKPHIVLMDINMPDMDGITATQKMSIDAPFSQVIIMSVQSDQHYMKRAMAAGARDFQPKPFTSEELVSCIRRVYNIGIPVYQQFNALETAQSTEVSQPDAPKVAGDATSPMVAVYSPKGGIGTSAIAANMAVILHQERGEAVLVDGSFQFGDISVHLNTRPTRTISDMIHEGRLEDDLLDDVLLAHSSGLKLLLAPSQPELAESINSTMVKDILGTLKNQFKTVVLDTTSKLNSETLSILELADFILVITSPELTAIKSAKLFLELAEKLEFDPEYILVVVNRVGIPGGVHPKQIEKVLKLDKTYSIPYDPKLHVSLNKGVPVYLDEASAPSSVALVKLAHVLNQKLSEFAPEAEEAT